MVPASEQSRRANARAAVDRITPYFSVIIPTYRRTGTLRRAIGSVLEQDFPYFELLVVDDDPEGSARDVVAGFEDARVAYLSNTGSRGGAGARNTGAASASGGWLAFLDDDDVWLKQKLKTQYYLIEGDGIDLGLVYSLSALYDFEKDRIIRVRLGQKDGYLSNDLLRRNVIGGLSTVVIRSEAFHEVRGFDEEMPALQDVELYIRIARRYRSRFVPVPLVLIAGNGAGRISDDIEKKLAGNLLFLKRNLSAINRDPRARARAAARILAFAYQARRFELVREFLPWTLASALFEPATIRETGRIIARGR